MKSMYTCPRVKRIAKSNVNQQCRKNEKIKHPKTRKFVSLLKQRTVEELNFICQFHGEGVRSALFWETFYGFLWPSFLCLLCWGPRVKKKEATSKQNVAKRKQSVLEIGYVNFKIRESDGESVEIPKPIFRWRRLFLESPRKDSVFCTFPLCVLCTRVHV